MISVIPAQSFIELIVVVDIAKTSGRSPKAGIALDRDTGDSTSVESSCNSYIAEQIRAGGAFTGTVLGRTAEAKPNDVHECRGYGPGMLRCGYGARQRVQSTGKRKET